MTTSYDSLVKILREVFQLDQADLDFGIYRILNQRSAEITDFLENKLLAQVKETLTQTQGHAATEAQAELDALLKALRDAGVPNPEETPKVKELRATIAQSGNMDALADEVFNHMATFFRRYYKEGDFISQRRYKDDVYAIPYSGEEVKLHWANHDQYYIKTAEYFKNYAFKFADKTISFELKEADTEQNNNRTQNNQERRFALHTEEPISYDATSLTIYFTYEPHPRTTKQKDLIDQAVETLRATVPSTFAEIWKTDDVRKSLLEKKLLDYTARNTFDYFIHKDLGGFLNRELDFYIKNEILHLDDIDYSRPQSIEKQLRLISAFKDVARKLIAFLAQLENFQKKLWLKKKLVVETNYCITLDRVPETLYPEIASNDAQVDEWIKLFAINEIEGDLVRLPFFRPLTVEFMRQNQFLVLDTSFFPKSFVQRLIQSIRKFDDQCDGLLINSENFQALRFLSSKTAADVVYIDPPYNAKTSEILYKNTFKHSSWISLMENRLSASKSLTNKNGVHVIAIDEVENLNLGHLSEDIFPNYEKSIISIVHNPTGQQGKNFSYTHEFAHFLYPRGGDYIGLEDREDDSRESQPDIRPLRNVSSGVDHLRESAANCFYPIFVKDGEIIGFGDVSPDNYHPGDINIIKADGLIEIYPIDPSGIESKWVFARDTVESILNELTAQYDSRKREWDIIRRKTKFRYKSLWSDKRYSANSWGSAILNQIIPNNPFNYPKSINTVIDCVDAALGNRCEGVVLDYFAGSGTTGHAVIKLNRNDKEKGKRKYILVEMGEYFDTVTKPRIQKVVYAKDWKDGKPVGRDGISQCFKTIRLESYEDTLNNLLIDKPKVQTDFLTERFEEEYTLNYWLDVETRNSLLNLETFRKPHGHTLQVTRNNERVTVGVDLVETFNYLIGLTVDSWLFFDHITVVVGRNRLGQKVLVLWRDTVEIGNDALNQFFRKQSINPFDYEYDRIYINGDNTLENIRTDSEHWKVVLIEQEFHRLMFEGTE
jgi:adenine-specific DNA-methyltransferase